MFDAKSFTALHSVVKAKFSLAQAYPLEAFAVDRDKAPVLIVSGRTRDQEGQTDGAKGI
jgi:hypothetical protein